MATNIAARAFSRTFGLQSHMERLGQLHPHESRPQLTRRAYAQDSQRAMRAVVDGRIPDWNDQEMIRQAAAEMQRLMELDRSGATDMVPKVLGQVGSMSVYKFFAEAAEPGEDEEFAAQLQANEDLQLFGAFVYQQMEM